jgi:ATP-binding protein involved in chromosome partitioning
MAEQYGSQVLGELPLDIRIRAGADAGQPIVVGAPEGSLAQTYRDIARRSAARLSLLSRQASLQLPVIIEA